MELRELFLYECGVRELADQLSASSRAFDSDAFLRAVNLRMNLWDFARAAR